VRNVQNFSWRAIGIKAALAASLLINIGLATKIAVFDPNARVKPICWDDDAGDLVSIDGPLTVRYMDSFDFRQGSLEFREDEDDNTYISLVDYWSDEQAFWNYTTHVVDYLVRNHGGEMSLPPYEIDGYGHVKVTCELVRAVAIEPVSDPQPQ
jgi:hypothetical protein